MLSANRRTAVMTGASPNSSFPGNAGYAGPAWFLTGGSSFNAISFLVRQIMAGKAFAGLVEVLSVSGGGLGVPPIVSVRPLVDQVDGFGNRTPHGQVFNIPCFRLQGGAGAVIVDPVVGDIGDAIVCHRDHSAVKATGTFGGPGSSRQNNWADGMYFGGFLNGAPACYVHVTPTTIVMAEPGGAQIVMSGGTIATTGLLLNNGSRVGSTHIHADPQGGDVGPPF